MAYAARVRTRTAEAEGRGEARDRSAAPRGTPHARPAEGRSPSAPFGRREKAVLVTFAIGIAALVFGVMRYAWYITEIAGLFIALGVAAGLVGGLGVLGTSAGFVQGARDLVSVAVIIGIARGILVVLDDGRVIDTLLHWTALAVEGVGPVPTAEVMYAVQTALNFFVPSGSGQAALTMPIMAPLADLVGVTRQTAVLAYQLGDGITMGGVAWDRWARWILPRQAVLFLLGALALVPAVLTGWTG